MNRILAWLGIVWVAMLSAGLHAAPLTFPGIQFKAHDVNVSLAVDDGPQPQVQFNALFTGEGTPQVYLDNPVGRYGFVTISGQQLTYRLNMTHPEVKALQPGQQLVDSIVYGVRPASSPTAAGSRATIRVVIVGPMNQPIAYDDVASMVVNLTANNPTLEINVKQNDFNAGEAYLVGSPIGRYGHIDGFVAATGIFTYRLDLSNAAVRALKNGQTLTDTFVYSVRGTGASQATDQATLTINILGPIQKFEARDLSFSLAVDAVVDPVVTFSVEMAGAGQGETFNITLVSSPTGRYGHISVVKFEQGRGEFTYALNMTNPAVRALKPGEELVETFVYRVSEGNAPLAPSDEGTVTIRILGPTGQVRAYDDIAAVAADVGAVDLNILDNDVNAVFAQLVSSPVGRYGHFEGEVHPSGQLTYRVNLNHPEVMALRPGNRLIDSFTYKVRGATPQSGTDQATITIYIVAGPVVQVLAYDDVVTVTVDSPVAEFDILANDMNAATVHWIGSPVGQYGQISGDINTGVLTYRLNLNHPDILALKFGEQLVDVFRYGVRGARPEEGYSEATITVYIGSGGAISFRAFDFVDTVLAHEDAASRSVTGNLLTYNNQLLNKTEADGVRRAELLSSQFGRYGYLQFASNGAFTYTLNNNVPEIEALRNSANALQDVFSYRLIDRLGVISATAKIVINIVSRREQTSLENVELEPNNRSSFATPLSSGGFMRGHLSSAGDKDWYYITSNGNEILHFEFCPQGTRCYNQKAWVLYIFDADFLTQQIEQSEYPLLTYNLLTGNVINRTPSNHMYLQYNAGYFDDALVGVIDPCFPGSVEGAMDFGGKTTVEIGVPTPRPGAIKTYFVAVSSPLARAAAIDEEITGCTNGSVVLQRTVAEDAANGSIIQQHIVRFPASDDQYMFRVTRSGVSPVALQASPNETLFDALTGNVTIPRIRAGGHYYSAQLQQLLAPRSADNTALFGITDLQTLNEVTAIDPFAGTYNPVTNIVHLPKVTVRQTGQPYAVNLRVLPDGKLNVLTVEPLK